MHQQSRVPHNTYNKHDYHQNDSERSVFYIQLERSRISSAIVEIDFEITCKKIEVCYTRQGDEQDPERMMTDVGDDPYIITGIHVDRQDIKNQ